MSTALVLFSGGQDSATCLAWALERFERVETIGFDYGQRHRVELEVRGAFRRTLAAAFPRWGERLGEDRVIALPSLAAIGDTAMTSDRAIEMGANGLPTTFVPGRNLLFLTYAAALAYRRGLKRLVTGVCETDYSGYPDCRDDTIKALQVALNLGTESRFVIETPLMWIDKAQTWAMAEALGGDALLELVREHTHTCYLGDRAHRHDWGYGCGDCPACDLRRGGYEQWRRERSAAAGVQPPSAEGGMTDGRAEDEDAPGAPQTGEAICPQCGGDGQLNGAPCPGCDGTGKITAIVGDA